MRLKLPIVIILTLTIALTAYGQTPETKGYELYSWKIKSHWYYSLLPRSTGSRSYDEITESSSVRRDTSGLEAELRKLRRGEDVFWMGDAPGETAKPPSRKALDLKHPSRQRIKRIRAICDKLGIRLKLA